MKCARLWPRLVLPGLAPSRRLWRLSVEGDSVTGRKRRCAALYEGRSPRPSRMVAYCYHHVAMSSPYNRFVWQNLNTTDAAAALAFYKTVCEWGHESFRPNPNEPSYDMWTAHGVPHSGVMQMPPGAESPPHWLGYVSVKDIEASVTKAQSLGAKVWVPPMDIPSIGRFAVLADPHGATFALIQEIQPTPEGPPQVGDFSWFELATRDTEKALAFYGAMFGWTAGRAMDMGEQGIYQLVMRGDQMMAGMYNITAQTPMPPCWCPYVRVADLNAALDRVRSAGGTVIIGPHDIPGGEKIGMGTDPQGAMFALHWRGQ